MDNIPLGAQYDTNAPFNEPLNIEHRRFVSVSISYYDEVELPPDATKEQIEEAFKQNVSDGKFPKEFDIDELVILDE